MGAGGWKICINRMLASSLSGGGNWRTNRGCGRRLYGPSISKETQSPLWKVNLVIPLYGKPLWKLKRITLQGGRWSSIQAIWPDNGLILWEMSPLYVINSLCYTIYAITKKSQFQTSNAPSGAMERIGDGCGLLASVRCIRWDYLCFGEEEEIHNQICLWISREKREGAWLQMDMDIQNTLKNPNLPPVTCPRCHSH